jgi:hypothetical protein
VTGNNAERARKPGPVNQALLDTKDVDLLRVDPDACLLESRPEVGTAGRVASARPRTSRKRACHGSTDTRSSTIAAQPFSCTSRYFVVSATW